MVMSPVKGTAGFLMNPWVAGNYSSKTHATLCRQVNFWCRRPPSRSKNVLGNNGFFLEGGNAALTGPTGLPADPHVETGKIWFMASCRLELGRTEY